MAQNILSKGINQEDATTQIINQIRTSVKKQKQNKNKEKNENYT